MSIEEAPYQDITDHPRRVQEPTEKKLFGGLGLAQRVIGGFVDDALSPRPPRAVLETVEEPPMTEEELADTEEGDRLRDSRQKRLAEMRAEKRRAYVSAAMGASGQSEPTTTKKGERAAEQARQRIKIREQQREAYIAKVLPAIKAEATEKYDCSAFDGVETEEEGPGGRMERVIQYTEAQNDEQIRQLGLVQDLIGERRDLARTLFAEKKAFEAERDKLRQEKEKKERAQPRVKMLGGRRIIFSRGNEPDIATPVALLAGYRRLEEIDHELAVLGAVPGLREAYADKLSVAWLLANITKQADLLQDRNVEIDDEIFRIRMMALEGEAGAVLGMDQKKIDLLLAEKEDNQRRIDAFLESEDGDRITRLRNLHNYTDSYAKGRLIEIPSVQETTNEALEHLSNHQPFLLAGHLGSGKTEVARHAAKLYMMRFASEEERFDTSDPQNPRERTMDELYDLMSPEFFSGSDEATVYDLIGKLKLKAKGIDADNVGPLVTELSEAMEKAGVRDVPPGEIAKILLGKGEATETVFNYGPFGRAIRRQVPIIVDELNRIPPETNSRMNDLLLRRPGTKIRLQENGEEEMEVGEGFGVLATCNLGAQYAGISDVDAAFASRWVAKEVSYPDVAETYDLAFTAILRKDRVQLPPDFPKTSFTRLVDLSVVVHEIQDVFCGKTQAQRFMALAGKSVVATRSQLEKTVISTRDLMRKILEPWVRSGFKRRPEDRMRPDEVPPPRKTPSATAPMPGAPVPAPGAPAETAPVAPEEIPVAEGDGATPVAPGPDGAVPGVGEILTPVEGLEDKVHEDGLDEIIARNILAGIVFSVDDQKLMVEMFIRRGFFAGWSQKRFERMGIKTVSQEEIDALQVAKTSQDYLKANNEMDELRKKAYAAAMEFDKSSHGSYQGYGAIAEEFGLVPKKRIVPNPPAPEIAMDEAT